MTNPVFTVTYDAPPGVSKEYGNALMMLAKGEKIPTGFGAISFVAEDAAQFGSARKTSTFLSDWIRLAREGTRREETRFEKLRKEVLAQPLPERTGEEWLRHLAEAMQAVMALQGDDQFNPEHPAKVALDIAYIQSAAAGWDITFDWGDETALNKDGLIEMGVTFDYAGYEKSN